MKKVALIQVYFNNKHFVDKVYDAVFASTFKDFDFYVVIAANDDGGKEYITQKYPEVKIIDPGYNIGFSKGHNFLFESLEYELFQLINPDLIITPTFLEEMVKIFDDEHVGAASGKLYQYDFQTNTPTKIFDSTGVIGFNNGRFRDRGQHREDHGQFDADCDLVGTSGAAAMYRKSALEKIAYPKAVTASSDFESKKEFYDEDFFMYWEDVDLSLRLLHAGYTIRFVPHAIAYHGRGSGSSKHGYVNVVKFAQHHKQLTSRARALNYKNHLFTVLKNFPKFYIQFFWRELFYHAYVLFMERSTLKVLSEVRSQFKGMRSKRKHILSTSKLSHADFRKHLKNGWL